MIWSYYMCFLLWPSHEMFLKIVHERWYDFWTFIGFFLCYKFQNRGSEHDQGLLWVANAPNLHGLDSNQIIDFFADKYITCDSDELTPNLHEAQRHHHKKIVEKKNQVICHFNLPWPLWKKHKFLNQYHFKIYPCWKKPV
jgi:hypothetical protein